jgi:hypothetical protein
MNLLRKLKSLRDKPLLEEPINPSPSKKSVSDIYHVPAKAKTIPPRVNGRRVDA